MTRPEGYHGPFSRGDRPLIWAHRGASGERPENTAAAFTRAAEQRADGAECDVMLCRSGELVVCHDERLDRLCGVPLYVRELPLDGLRELPVLGSREVTPTLEEAVEAGGPSLLWNVELKVDRTADAEPLARAAAAELARLGLQRRVLVSSFHPHALLTFRTAAPDIPTAYLWEGDGLHHALLAALTATLAVHPEARHVTPERVSRWHARGRLVNAWTVDDPARMTELSRAGVDGIITNWPAVGLRAVAG